MLLKAIAMSKKGIGLGICGASYIPMYAGKGLVAAGSALISVGATIHEYGESVCEGADIAMWVHDNVKEGELEEFMATYKVTDPEKALEMMYHISIGKAAERTAESTVVKDTGVVVETAAAKGSPTVVNPTVVNPTVGNSTVVEEAAEVPPHVLAAELC